MKNVTSLIVMVALFISSCASSVQPLGGHTMQPLRNCNVKVFASLEAARANGDIEELCMIMGTGVGSFFPTVATAVQKHKDKACECGAENVYIHTQYPDTASVALIGFKYK